MSLKFKLCVFITTLMICSISLAAPPPGKGGGGKNKTSLSLAVTPESFLESDAGATGTVTRANSDTSVALTVTLASNDTSEATVPSSVQIVAGASSAEFFITAVDDDEVDGDQLVTISASALDHSGASAQITVVDVAGDGGGSETGSRPTVAYDFVSVLPPDVGGYVNVIGGNDIGQFVGTYHNGDGNYRGFVFDLATGLMDLNTLVAPTDPVKREGWNIVASFGINNQGSVACWLISDEFAGQNLSGFDLVPAVLELSTGKLTMVLPYTPGVTGYGRPAINEYGEVVADYKNLSTGELSVYVLNPGVQGATREDPELLPFGSTNGIAMNSPVNSPTQISSSSWELFGGSVYTRGGQLEFIADWAPDYEVSDLAIINDFGEVLSAVKVGEEGKRRKAKPITQLAIVSDGSVDLLPGTRSDELNRESPTTFNNSRDTAFRERLWVTNDDGLTEARYRLVLHTAGVNYDVVHQFTDPDGNRDFDFRFEGMGMTERNAGTELPTLFGHSELFPEYEQIGAILVPVVDNN